jgi:hypothetical protein
LGKPFCAGGCVKGNTSYCETPRPANWAVEQTKCW